MALPSLTEKELQETLQENEKVVLKFTATWCGPCKMLNPTLERAAQAHPDIRFVEVDVEKEPGLAQAFQVRSIPAVFGLKKDQRVFQFVGNVPPATLEEHLQGF